MPERYDDARNRERDERHRRDHDNHSGYGSMYDRGYDYGGSAEDHGRGRLHQAGPGHHDADWGREKQQQRFGGQQQHGGYGQDEGWRRPSREPQWGQPGFDDRHAGGRDPRQFDNWGARGYAGGYGSDVPRGGADYYGTGRDGGRTEEGGFARDQSGGFGRDDSQGFQSRGDERGSGRQEGWRGDDRPDDRSGGGGMRRMGEQVRSFFDRHRGEHEGEHDNRFFGRGRDDDTGWNDRMSDARTDGAQYGHRREGLWGERRQDDPRQSQDRGRMDDRDARHDRDDPNRWFDRR